MMRMLMIVALLTRAVLPSMEKHQAKAGPQRVEVLRMVAASQAVIRVDRVARFRKAVPRGRARGRLRTAPRKAKRPKATPRGVAKVACGANPPKMLAARATLPKVALPRMLAIRAVPLAQVLPTASFRLTAERSCSIRWAMPSTATAAWRSRVARCS